MNRFVTLFSMMLLSKCLKWATVRKLFLSENCSNTSMIFKIQVNSPNKVLPASAGRSYGDMTQPNTAPTPSASGQRIKVDITVRYERTWQAKGNEGDSMFDVMQKLGKQDPSFRFTSETYKDGQKITSIVGIETGSDHFWKFFRDPNKEMMSKGVSDTKPNNGDHYLFEVDKINTL